MTYQILSNLINIFCIIINMLPFITDVPNKKLKSLKKIAF